LNSELNVSIIKNFNMKKYRCAVCGHEYDEAEGDPIRGFPLGTLFEDLPDDWTCPVCGVGKDEYVEMD
jgi:rubredoxin